VVQRVVQTIVVQRQFHVLNLTIKTIMNGYTVADGQNIYFCRTKGEVIERIEFLVRESLVEPA
jgi:hypothetical protein